MSSNTPIHAVQFTARGESMCVALSNGFAVFTLNPTLKKRFHRFFEGQQFGNATTIHDSNIIVCTGVAGQKSFADATLCVFDESIGRVVLEVSCSETIQQLFMLPHMFALSSRSEIRLYTFDPPILHSQFRTFANDYAPCDFVQTGETDFVVGMTGRQPGMLRLVRGERCDVQDRTIEAHTRPLSVIRFNASGSLVATSSSLGTVIKVHNTSSGECVAQFRRGTLAAEISSIAFSNESELLAVASSKGTVHIFQITAGANAEVSTRSEMKVQHADLGTAVLCFADRTKLYAASRNGKLFTVRVSEASKSASIEQCDSFMDMITITK